MSRKDLEELRERVEKLEITQESHEKRWLIVEKWAEGEGEPDCVCGHTYHQHHHKGDGGCLGRHFPDGDLCACSKYRAAWNTRKPPAPAPEEEREPGNEATGRAGPDVEGGDSCDRDIQYCENQCDIVATCEIYNEPIDPDYRPSHPDHSSVPEDNDVHTGGE